MISVKQRQPQRHAVSFLIRFAVLDRTFYIKYSFRASISMIRGAKRARSLVKSKSSEFWAAAKHARLRKDISHQLHLLACFVLGTEIVHSGMQYCIRMLATPNASGSMFVHCLCSSPAIAELRHF